MSFRRQLMAGFGKRIREALRSYELREDRDLTRREIGELVARRTGEKPRAHSTVLAWLEGRAMPDALTMAGIAQAFDVDPGWLAFGPLSRAPKEGMTAEERKAMEGVAGDLAAGGEAFDDQVGKENHA